jgi:hypothetical protein
VSCNFLLNASVFSLSLFLWSLVLMFLWCFCCFYANTFVRNNCFFFQLLLIARGGGAHIRFSDHLGFVSN